MNMIASNFKKIVLKRCADWYSKVGDLKLTLSDISLLFSYKDVGEQYDLIFTECHCYEPKKVYEYEDVIGKDVMNTIEQSVPGVISQIMVKMCEAHKIGFEAINVFAVPSSDNKNVDIALYNGFEFVKWMSVDELIETLM